MKDRFLRFHSRYYWGCSICHKLWLQSAGTYHHSLDRFYEYAYACQKTGKRSGNCLFIVIHPSLGVLGAIFAMILPYISGERPLFKWAVYGVPCGISFFPFLFAAASGS